MAVERDIYERLRPPQPTAVEDLCACSATTPIKLMSTGGMGFNPIHCLNCNLEVPPERLGIDAELASDVASWLAVYGAIDRLELDSGDYEIWAQSQLLDPHSPPNVEGRNVARRLGEHRRCYLWFFQPRGDDGFIARSTCPNCERPLNRYDKGIFPQLLCEACDIVLAA